MRVKALRWEAQSVSLKGPEGGPKVVTHRQGARNLSPWGRPRPDRAGPQRQHERVQVGRPGGC